MAWSPQGAARRVRHGDAESVERRVRHGDAESVERRVRHGDAESVERRVRFSVRVPAQNAPFRRVRFSLPAQTWSRLTEKRILGVRPHGKAHSERLESRKSAFWEVGVTEKRTLGGEPHGKAHSESHRLGRVHLSVRPDSEPRPANPRATRPAAWRGGLRERICPVEAFSIVPRSLAGGCPTPPGRRDVTEKRILPPVPHGKAQSGDPSHGKAQFSLPRDHTPRLSASP